MPCGASRSACEQRLFSCSPFLCLLSSSPLVLSSPSSSHRLLSAPSSSPRHRESLAPQNIPQDVTQRTPRDALSPTTSKTSSHISSHNITPHTLAFPAPSRSSSAGTAPQRRRPRLAPRSRAARACPSLVTFLATAPLTPTLNPSSRFLALHPRLLLLVYVVVDVDVTSTSVCDIDSIGIVTVAVTVADSVVAAP
eukprot:2689590-Rhodomonas_salina.1